MQQHVNLEDLVQRLATNICYLSKIGFDNAEREPRKVC